MSIGSDGVTDVVGRVAVAGAGGKTGRAVEAALRVRGVTVVPIGRAQQADLATVLADVDALYLIAPNMHEDEPGFVGRMLDAAAASGVRRIGYHSVAAPHVPSMPHHLGKAVSEDLVRRSGAAWTILQPCAYVQNFVPGLRGPEPVLRVAYSPRTPFGLVDLTDVAEAAATVLLSADHIGATYELGGPRLVTVEDVAAVAEQVLGRTVPVERISVAQWRSGDDAAPDPRVRDWLAAMFAYYDEHGLPVGPLPLAGVLGRSPTSLATTLARELVDVASG